jgi:flagellar biosynthesis chaperone FliJ
MNDDSEYEILPHEELERLRNEVEQIKKNPLGKKYEGSDLIDAVHNLTQTISTLNTIFKSTNEEMLEDFQNHTLHNNFKTISTQNEEIAKGILSVAQLVQKQTELLEKLMEKMDKGASLPEQTPTPQNNMSGISVQNSNYVAPQIKQQSESSNQNPAISNPQSEKFPDFDMSELESLDTPPPNEVKEEPKKGFFSKFK